VFDQEQHDPGGEQEEHELCERVRRRDVPGGVHDRGRDEEEERSPDGVATVEVGPHREDHVGHEQADKDLGVRNVHRARSGTGPGLLSYAAHRPSLPARSYNTRAGHIRFT